MLEETLALLLFYFWVEASFPVDKRLPSNKVKRVTGDNSWEWPVRIFKAPAGTESAVRFHSIHSSFRLHVKLSPAFDPHQRICVIRKEHLFNKGNIPLIWNFNAVQICIRKWWAEGGWGGGRETFPFLFAILFLETPFTALNGKSYSTFWRWNKKLDDGSAFLIKNS